MLPSERLRSLVYVVVQSSRSLSFSTTLLLTHALFYSLSFSHTLSLSHTHTHAGVFFTVKMDGTMDVWDLYYKHNKPSLTVQVLDHSLTTFAAHDLGATVAVGTADGSVTVLGLSAGLSEMALNERAAINNMFDRETAQEKNLEKAIKEAKVKARKEAARKDEVADNVTEEQLQQIVSDFMQATANKEIAEQQAEYAAE